MALNTQIVLLIMTTTSDYVENSTSHSELLINPLILETSPSACLIRYANSNSVALPAIAGGELRNFQAYLPGTWTGRSFRKISERELFYVLIFSPGPVLPSFPSTRQREREVCDAARTRVAISATRDSRAPARAREHANRVLRANKCRRRRRRWVRERLEHSLRINWLSALINAMPRRCRRRLHGASERTRRWG